MSLKQKVHQLTLIEDWYNATTGAVSKLIILFNDSITQTNVFDDIYVAIRHNPENASEASSETFNYYNVGFTTSQIAAYFNTKYGLNYFAYNYNSPENWAALRLKIKSIYEANLYKYRKLIEVLGYSYNPLYNVDGIELYSRGEAIGDGSSKRTPTGTVITTTGTENNSTIGETTSTFYKNPYDESGTDADFVEAKNTQSAITSKQSYGTGDDEYSETTSFENIPANNYSYDEKEGKWKPNGVFSIAAKDNAFGVEFNGPERYYAEKKIRQGNIGITKSTELLQSQREIVRFNILDEFFNDLEPHIVVGIY